MKTMSSRRGVVHRYLHAAATGGGGVVIIIVTVVTPVRATSCNIVLGVVAVDSVIVVAVAVIEEFDPL